MSQISTEQKKYIIAHINDRPRSAVAKAAGVSISVMYNMVRKHGGDMDYRRSKRTDKYDDIVRKHYRDMSGREIDRKFGFPLNTSNKIAKRLGLSHSQETINRVCEERKRKLQLVIDEAGMTKHYLETLDMEPINRHVKEYLYMCLMSYTKETLRIGERTALYIVPECLARMYECIMNGMCLYNYERYCKQMLLNYKKKGNFGFTGHVPKPIEIKVQQLKLDCLWERYKKSKTNK